MHPSHQRRLDVIILLSSAILGLGITVLWFAMSPGVLLYALLPTAVIAMAALTYADGSISDEPLAEE